MLESLLNIKDLSKLSDEQITQGYQLLKEYCDNKDLDVMDVLNNPENIKPAAEEIHKNLSFAIRMILKKNKIEDMITQNLDFIRDKAQFYINEEKKAAKAAKKVVKPVETVDMSETKKKSKKK